MGRFLALQQFCNLDFHVVLQLLFLILFYRFTCSIFILTIIILKISWARKIVILKESKMITELISLASTNG